MVAQNYLTAALKEIGLLSIWNSTLDVKLLCFQRFVRLFAYGGSTLILALYLSALGNSERYIGFFMTLTLWGDVVISFFLTMSADGLGRKAVLAVGAAMMTASGLVFAISGNYWVLLAAAILGVISPSGNEIGPFRAVEESTLAHLTTKETRADVYAWYVLIGSGGVALGTMTCGWTVERLKKLRSWDDVRAYRAIFFAYAVAGVLKFILALFLSNKCEVDSAPPLGSTHGASEQTSLLNGDVSKKSKPSLFSRIIPRISPESRAILLQLCLLFALDSFASGLVAPTWVTYFFKRKFGVPDGFLGTLFFTTNIIAALSTLGAASLARRFGNIKTMVFTHLPSSIFLALIPVPPQLAVAATLLVLRSCTQSMDTAPRSAFLAAVVLPNERTAVMGTINVIKTFSQSFGPGVTGVLYDKRMPWLAFVMSGALKAAYDLGLLAVFAGHVSAEQKAEQAARDEPERLLVEEESLLQGEDDDESSEER